MQSGEEFMEVRLAAIFHEQHMPVLKLCFLSGITHVEQIRKLGR